MASLKEVKARIASVNSTLKITSAMKMVASAKLHRAQAAIESMLPYEKKLNSMLAGFLTSGVQVDSTLAREREVQRVALVAVSSNTSLCGAFNANVIKKLNARLEDYQSLGRENILIYPIGKKVEKAVRKEGYEPQGSYQSMIDKPDYQAAAELAEQLMEMFEKGEVDRVELIYNHFKSTAVQVMTDEQYLPVEMPEEPQQTPDQYRPDYIVEPSAAEVVQTLVPQVLSLKIFTILLDSSAAEHAARTIAMQMATDNATALLQELKIQYNKSRQQAITNELLDMMGLAARRDHKPGQLSGGEQQRVAIARALASEARVLLADEPSGNLDSHNRDEIHRLFFDLRERLGQTVVIVTHDENLAAMADRKITMSDGLILGCETVR